MTNDVRDQLVETYGAELLFMDPPEQFDVCIVGVAGRCGSEPFVIYDTDRVIAALMRGGMELEEAHEWFEYNVLGSWLGDSTPAFIETVDTRGLQ